MVKASKSPTGVKYTLQAKSKKKVKKQHNPFSRVMS